jgi:hypothetical protein
VLLHGELRSCHAAQSLYGSKLSLYGSLSTRLVREFNGGNKIEKKPKRSKEGEDPTFNSQFPFNHLRHGIALFSFVFRANYILAQRRGKQIG